uniref:Uncharacterized protein n=1 Tax=Tanacetum cinerariifolium TaxID=118510 RepID=A0A6L2LIJ3_TANCI|nr:hypothetical protein [Tanacetum cinerariifolium]
MIGLKLCKLERPPFEGDCKRGDVGDDLNGGVGLAIYRVKEAFVPKFSSWIRVVTEQDKHTQALENLKLKKRVKKLENKRRSKHSGGCIQTVGKIEAIDANEDISLVDEETQVDMDVELQGRIDQDVSAATKDVSAAEPTVFDDEEVIMTMA